MDFLRKLALFGAGGSAYVGLELLWRGRSHGSMFLAGGSCFLLLGQLNRLPCSLTRRAVAGAGAITAVELITGLVFNRDYGVWDYRELPANFRGHICLPFSLLWVPLSAAGMKLYQTLDSALAKKR